MILARTLRIAGKAGLALRWLKELAVVAGQKAAASHPSEKWSQPPAVEPFNIAGLPRLPKCYLPECRPAAKS
jgi:hypothetical protein